MTDGPGRACLAIADVGGDAGYLPGPNPTAAQHVLADLIDTTGGRWRPCRKAGSAT